MPSVSVACIAMALKAMFAMVVFGATGVAVVGFANDYSFGPTGTSFLSAVQHQTVQFIPGFYGGPCHTCLHVRSDNADIQQLWENKKPSPTLPLKISYASPKIQPKPTPTPPPTARKASTTPASSSISRFLAPLHGASPLAISSAWYLIVLRYLVFVLDSKVPSVIICKIICVVSFTATLAYLIPPPSSCQRWLQLPTKMTEILGKVMAIALFSFRELPTKTTEILGKVLAFALFSFHKLEMLLSMGRYKARTNGIPNLEFRRPRKVHADIPTAFCEQCLFATADIAPSFGPSIQNAETEFRSLLERIEGQLDRQADIVAFFRKTLDSFTRALAVAEATSEGRDTRYLMVIQDQDRLIDELRMLHEYREQAFRENEELVELLCPYEDGSLKIPEGSEQKPPFNKYSAEYDKFIISPLDGPAALSMKVSVQSAPFHRRPVTILDSDPYWQRFLESTAEKRSEQEVRLASHEDDLNNWDEKEGEDVKDGCVQGTCNVSQSSGDKYFDKTGGGDGIRGDDIGEDDIGRDDIGVNDSDSPNDAMELAKISLAWFEWKLSCMKGSQGTTGGSDSTKSSGIPPAITARVTEDVAYARWMQEQTWADYPKQLAIRDCESSINMLKAKIAWMKSKATSEGRTRKGRKGETLPEPTAAKDSPLSRLALKPNQRSD